MILKTDRDFLYLLFHIATFSYPEVFSQEEGAVIAKLQA